MPTLPRPLSAALHAAAAMSCSFTARKYIRALGNLRETQEQMLRVQLGRLEGSAQAERFGLHKGLTPAEFRKRVPERTYTDFEEDVRLQRKSGAPVLSSLPALRYQPTSGSGNVVKWIPYTQGFLDDVDAAVGPWMYDLYRQVPGLRKGRHYWSLSWLPEELRKSHEGNLQDDRELLSPAKRIFSALASPVPSRVAYTPSAEDSFFASLCYLAAARDLTVLSVWSPTFGLGLLERIATRRKEAAAVLRSGTWEAAGVKFETKAPKSIEGAQWLERWDGHMGPGAFDGLWPQLAFVSAWATSTSVVWAKRLKDIFPNAFFQGKGLLATEGVVTIPFEGRYPLTVLSHFYEFVDMEDNEPRFSWELEVGQEVRPLITAGSGLVRYALPDRLIVREMLQETPSFEFLGRIAEIDLVGEKMSPAIAQASIAMLAESDHAARPISMIALDPARTGGKPQYCVVCTGERDASADKRRSQQLETKLRESFHYGVARDLGQLGPAWVVTLPDGMPLYEAVGTARSISTGNLKVEHLVRCDAQAFLEIAERFSVAAPSSLRQTDASAPAASEPPPSAAGAER